MSNNKRYFPNVVIDGYNVEYEIINWLGIQEYEINRCMRVLLSRLGYNEDDFISIDRCYCCDDGYMYLELNVNGGVVNRIGIFNNREDNYPCIKLDKDENGREFYYQVVIDGINNVYLNMYRYSDINNDRIYNYELSREWVEYRIEDGEYSLEFRLSKPVSKKSEFGGYRKYEINNQGEFVNYLVSLDFSKSILDIYKDICEISIGSDMSKYSLIDLRLNRYVCDNDGIIENRLTDMLYFEDGRLVSLIISKDNKQISYDGCFDSASYVYDSDMIQMNVSEFSNNRVNNVSERLRYKNDEYLDSDMNCYVDDARSEISNVKKLVIDINRNGIK